MNHGSLFSGIGGFDLAAQWMGWENVFHCEINPFCQQILKYHFPDAETLTDIKETDFTIYRNRINILTGGFPCQPFSLAGKRKGKEDDRHLWPEMLRAIREIQPGWIVGENVFGIVNWSGGMVFDEVQTSLEAEGYEIQPFILPACGVNAPHRRDRVWFVAYRNSNGFNRSNGEYEINTSEGREYAQRDIEPICSNVTNSESGSDRYSLYSSNKGLQGEFRGIYSEMDERGWEEFPTQSPLCSRNDGLSFGLAGTTFSKWRNESIKALGNSIVPQVVFQIFKAIEEYNKLCQHSPKI